MPIRRLAVVIAVMAALFFAVQGGEYSTADLVRQRSRERVLRQAIDSLRADVDSLARLQRRIATDPALQERIAREQNSMVKSDKELVYRFEPSAPSER